MNLSDLTVCLLYYNEPKSLYLHLDEMKWFLEFGTKYMVIDDGSLDSPIEDHVALLPEGVIVYKILQDFPWNIPGARNLGAHLCDTDWLVHLDSDLVFTKQAIINLSKFNVSADFFYSFRRSGAQMNKPTAGTLLLNKEVFWRTGGYNELFRGSYGFNDPYLKYRLNKIGIAQTVLDDVCLVDNSDVCGEWSLPRSTTVNLFKYHALKDVHLDFLSPKLRFQWKKIL